MKLETNRVEKLLLLTPLQHRYAVCEEAALVYHSVVCHLKGRIMTVGHEAIKRENYNGFVLFFFVLFRGFFSVRVKDF